MEREVTIFSEGEKVVGTFCLPDGIEGRVPAVALLHGYGSSRDELGGFVELAMLLAEHDIGSLRFDFRGCGESGKPGRIHPHDDWIADAMAAISFLEIQAEVDAGRLALVGMSVGGGAVQAGALDEQVRCVVFLAPVADGGRWLKHPWTSTQGEAGWQRFLGQLAVGRKRQTTTGESQKVLMEDIIAYGPEDAAAREQMLKEYP